MIRKKFLRRDDGERYLIKNLLVGESNLYPVGEGASFYPLFDAILLRFQEARIITIFQKEGVSDYKLFYTSLQDPEYYSKFKAYIKKNKSLDNLVRLTNKFYIAVWSFQVTRGNIKFQKARTGDTEKLSRLIESLNDEFGKHVLEAIETGLEDYKNRFGSDYDRELPSLFTKGADLILEDQDIVSFRNHMRTVIDEAFQSVARSPILNSGGEDSFLDLFAVVRYPLNDLRRGLFGYTAQLLLSNDQKQNLEKIIIPTKETKKDRYEKSLEYLRSINYSIRTFVNDIESNLGNHSRAVADSIFYSGLVDFSPDKAGEGEGRDAIGHSTNDLRRLKAEHILFSRLVPSGSPRPFYVPIHVGGHPWIGLFTFSYLHAEYRWAHNYQVYRTLIPRVAERLRVRAMIEYTSQIVDTLIENISNPIVSQFDIEKANSSLKRLGGLYPFQILSIHRNPETGSLPLKLPSEETLYLKASDNPYFVPQVKYDKVPVELGNIKKEFEARSVKNYEISVDQLRARLRAQEHTIFNILPNRQLELAINADESELRGQAKRWVVDAKRALEIVTASLSIVFRPDEYRIPSEDTNTVLTMIKWFEERTLSSQTKPSISIASPISDVILIGKSRQHAYTIIWNLWNNAIKNLRNEQLDEDYFGIKIYSDQAFLYVDFENGGEIPDPWLKYINGEGLYPGTERTSGLAIIKDILKETNWQIHGAVRNDKKTSIVLKIPLS